MKKDTKNVKEVAAGAVKTFQEQAVKVEKGAEKAAGDMKTTVAEVRTKAVKTREAAVKTVKAAEVVAEKTVRAAGEAVKKAPARRKPKETVYLQYQGKEINKDALIEKVHTAWTGEHGKKLSEIKDITLYLKPEDNAAYYVVNGDISGKISF